jgi:hypothetical protein
VMVPRPAPLLKASKAGAQTGVATRCGAEPQRKSNRTKEGLDFVGLQMAYEVPADVFWQQRCLVKELLHVQAFQS